MLKANQLLMHFYNLDLKHTLKYRYTNFISYLLALLQFQLACSYLAAKSYDRAVKTLYICETLQVSRWVWTLSVFLR